MTKMPNKPKMMKYHIATKHHAIKMRQSAIGTSKNHLSAALSVSVIFHIRAADPEKEVGADTTTFSDASLSLIVSSIR